MTRDLAINKFLAENNISSRDRLFECVFNHSSVGQAIALSSGKMCLNRAFCDWLGFPEEEMRDKSWKDFVCPEDVEPFQKTVERLFSGEIDSDISIRRFIRKDGTILWGKAHVSHCRNVPESGDILVTTVADITSDVNKQEIINKSAQTNRIIADCMLKPFASAQEQLNYALCEAVTLTESRYGYIVLYGENQKVLSWSAGSGVTGDDCAAAGAQMKNRLETAGVWEEAVRQRKPVVINDLVLSAPFLNGGSDLRRFMSIPIFENERIAAIIGFAGKRAAYTDNDVYGMTALMNGVWIATLKKKQEKETAQLLERTQAMINNHEAVMLLIEPTTGSIIEANHAATEFYGYSREELLGINMKEINMLGAAEVGKLLIKVLHGEQKYFTVPHRLKNGDVKTVDVYSSPIEYNGGQVLFSVNFDVTKREEATKQNEYLSNHDHLIGIYNRKYFEDAFNRLNNEAGYPVGIILGDVNALKSFNDSYGHAAGDKALKEISRRMQEAVEDGDVFARVGGDEFVVLTTRTSEDMINAYMDRIEQHVNGCAPQSDSNALTISFGFGIQRSGKDGLDDLIKEAEAFMYSRKCYSNRSTRSNTINVIMDALFAKSERERDHSDRVGLICEVIATHMQMNKEQVDRIRVAGFLHDIGKIGINEGILNKIGKLDEDEWESMKLHPAKGARILENTPEFKDLSNIVLLHHERYDGTGYPNGIKKEEIPVEARIITVADSYDAMANERPYRPAMDEDSIVKELIRCSGTQFDPQIVSMFINVVLPQIRPGNTNTPYAPSY